jgi:hypothetical protein
MFASHLAIWGLSALAKIDPGKDYFVLIVRYNLVQSLELLPIKDVVKQYP